MAQHQAPFVKPAIYPLGLEIGLKLQAITSHLQQKSHSVDLQLKKRPQCSSHSLLSAVDFLQPFLMRAYRHTFAFI